MKCDNGRREHVLMGASRFILCPGGCYDDEATRQLTVYYTESKDGERDTLNLCEKCAKLLKKDARRHGYRVETKPLATNEAGKGLTARVSNLQ